MKKTVIVVILLAVIVLIARPFLCKNNDKKSDQPEEKQQPLSVGDNSDAFKQSFAKLLETYNTLKDALVASDTAKASAAALALRTASDSLKVNEIKGDSTGVIKQTATSYTSSISGSAQALVAEKDLINKRKEFAVIADAMYTLIRTVRYSGETPLYWEYCPMAFDNKGAYWISKEKEIKNPYFGNEMLNCGSVEDSLSY